MQLGALILAEDAVVSEGRLYIHGGGWNGLAAAGFPIHPKIGVACMLVFSREEIPTALDLTIEVVGPGGTVAQSDIHLEVGVVDTAEEAQLSSPAVPLAVQFQLRIDEPGLYECRVTDESERVIGSTQFQIIAVTAPNASPQPSEQSETAPQA